MPPLKYRAVIGENTIIYFTLKDLVNPDTLFSTRELLIPWLLAGNQPDVWTGKRDRLGKEIYTGDIMYWERQEGVWSDQSNKMQLVKHPVIGANADLGKVVGNIYLNPELNPEAGR